MMQGEQLPDVPTIRDIVITTLSRAGADMAQVGIDQIVWEASEALTAAEQQVEARVLAVLDARGIDSEAERLRPIVPSVSLWLDALAADLRAVVSDPHALDTVKAEARTNGDVWAEHGHPNVPCSPPEAVHGDVPCRAAALTPDTTTGGGHESNYGTPVRHKGAREDCRVCPPLDPDTHDLDPRQQ